MHHVVKLHFDRITEQHLRSLWRKMIDRGFARDEDYLGACPHISITSADPVDPQLAQDWLSSIASSTNFGNIEFSYLGVFPEPAKVLFLGITLNKILMSVQEMLYLKLVNAGIRQHPLYAPIKIVFHTTLVPNSISTEISDPLKIALNAKLPSNGSVERIALVEYPGGRRIVDEQIRA